MDADRQGLGVGERVDARLCELVIEDYCVPPIVSTIMGTPPLEARRKHTSPNPLATPPGSALDSLTLCLAQLLVRIGSGRWVLAEIRTPTARSSTIEVRAGIGHAASGIRHRASGIRERGS